MQQYQSQYNNSYRANIKEILMQQYEMSGMIWI